MKKKFGLFTFLALLGASSFLSVQGQSIEQRVVNSSGGTKFVNGIRHDFSFGESGSVSTVEVPNSLILTQGFLQPVQPMSCSALVPGMITSDFSVCGNQAFSLMVQNSSAGDFYQNGQWQYLSQGGVSWMNITGAHDTVYNSPGLNVTTQFRYYLFCLNDSNTVQQSQIVTVTVLATPQVDLGADQTLCEGATIILDAGAGSNYVYQWSNGSTNQQITVSSGQEYSVIVDNGICSGKDTIFLNYIQAPSATSINVSNNSVSSFSFSPANVLGNQTYLWDFGDGNTETGENVDHNYAQPGTYTVTLTISNSCGTFVATTTVVVQTGTSIGQNSMEEKIKLYPNPATDFLIVESAESSILHYKIYNTLGQLILETSENRKRFQIDLRGLASGLYTIQLNTKPGYSIQKFQVK